MNGASLRVAFRADASPQIGHGHVKRCLALGQALRAVGAEVTMVSRALGLDTGTLCREAGIGFIELPAANATASAFESGAPLARWAQVDATTDAAQTSLALAGISPDWLIVDHYAFDADWHRSAAQRLGCAIAVIDDLADRELDASLLIDQNLSDDHRAKYRGRLSSGRTRILGGPRHALLGPRYARAQPVAPRDTVESIGIFMGGTDPHDLSSVALRACRESACFGKTIEIATTSANPHAGALRALAAKWPDTRVTADLPDLADFFGRHDLQIGAGGGASWERCCLGAPALVLVTAANQLAVVPELVRLGAAAGLAPSSANDETSIGAAVHSLLGDAPRRRSLARAARALVDGLGAKRVALSIAAESLTVRPATMADADAMFRWRNDPTTRSVSHTGGEIAWEQHLAWLKRTLSDPQRRLLVGRVGEIDVGVIRFDVSPARQALVSLYLDPDLHQLGLGRYLLQAGEAQLLASTQPRPEAFHATIVDGNTTSERLFSSGGYHLAHGLWRKPAPRASLER